nr:ash family protein [Klebsiella pneumoniae]
LLFDAKDKRLVLQIRECYFCDQSSTTSLAVNCQSRYLLPVPANSGAGIGLPNIIPATYDALASFLCRAFGYTSMVGWAGAPQGAPV